MAGALAGEGPGLRGPGPLRLPILYGITDARGGRSHAEAASLLLEAGVRLVQARVKLPSARALLEAARGVVALARAHDALVLVNDRPDVALLAAADGVHLGEEDLPPAAARLVLGAAPLVGLSTHSVAAARAAMAEPQVSYVALGPIFATASKETPHAALGLGAIGEAARGKTKPLVVIGGIAPRLVGECLAAGADSVAMIAGLLDGDPKANVAAALRSAARTGLAP